MKLSQIGEFGLIELIKKTPARRKDTILGTGDDCAVLSGTGRGVRGSYLLVTTDTLVENVHFRLEKTSFHDLGYYSLFVNVSDVASMGGTPTHAFITIGAPGGTNVRSIHQFYKGLKALAGKFNTDIAGGDTVRSDKFIISITLLGKVEKKFLLTRAGARPGDLILATGHFGGAAANNYDIRPASLVPRIKEARTIAQSKLATSMIDSSDGLVRSVLEISKASKVGALIYGSEVPVARGATLKQALHGGEEYELVFTVPRANVPRLAKILKKTKLSIVGEIRPRSKGVGILNERGRIEPVRSGGYEHFK